MAIVLKTKKGSDVTKPVAVAHEQSLQNYSDVAAEVTGEKAEKINRNKQTDTVTVHTANYLVDFVPGEIPL